MNKILIAIIALVLIGGGMYFVTKSASTPSYEKDEVVEITPKETEQETKEILEEEEEVVVDKTKTVIGASVENREIMAYHFGEGDVEVLFVGGVHGGYSWNTALVAYELIEYLQNNEDAVPEGVTVTVIPALNPDGLSEVTGKDGAFKVSDVSGNAAALVAARFNTNEVDLNRNFNCEWQESGTWQSRTVSGGDAPFSEPESQALRNYVEGVDPAAVVTWYAAAGGVYASSCRNGILPETLALTNLYADAAGYTAFEEFDFYEITGDLVNWLAAKQIPAISVLLSDRENSEWTKNEAGIMAVLNHYAE